VNRHRVSSSGPMLSSSPVRATISPGRQQRTAAINSGSSPDANVSPYVQIDVSLHRTGCILPLLKNAPATTLCHTTQCKERRATDSSATFQCTSAHLSDPASLTATLVKERWNGFPSAVPRCSVEMRSGPAFL
jgi:hypothetical protein